MSSNEMIAKVAEYEEWKALIAEAQEVLAEIEDEFKAALAEQGVDEMEVGDKTVRFKEIVSDRFDVTRFKNDFKDVYDAYRKPSISHRFTIA